MTTTATDSTVESQLPMGQELVAVIKKWLFHRGGNPSLESLHWYTEMTALQRDLYTEVPKYKHGQATTGP